MISLFIKCDDYCAGLTTTRRDRDTGELKNILSFLALQSSVYKSLPSSELNMQRRNAKPTQVSDSDCLVMKISLRPVLSEHKKKSHRVSYEV